MCLHPLVRVLVLRIDKLRLGVVAVRITAVTNTIILIILTTRMFMSMSHYDDLKG